MSITILPDDAAGIVRVTGDMDRALAMPGRSHAAGYVISLSDGTLLSGRRDVDPQRPIDVEVEGAGLVRSISGGVTVEWRVEWLTIAASSEAILPPRPPAELPLFSRCALA